MNIKETELKHVKKILDNSDLSANSYNKFRKHLSKLFGILCANSCLIQNPCEYIPTKIHIKKKGFQAGLWIVLAGLGVVGIVIFGIYKYLKRNK